MPEKKEDLSQKKENAILTITQLADADFNGLLDAIVLIATAAKRKTSIGQIGVRAIMNEKEPEPEPKPEPESGSEPGEKKDVG